MLLLLITVIPIIGALIALIFRNKNLNIPLLTSTIVLIISFLGLKSVFGGESIFYKLPLDGPFVPTFRADPLSVIFVVLAAFLWVLVSLYAPRYMKHEGRLNLFNICTLLVLSAVLGVFLAGDLFTMLLFFELMTITSYFWVVHRWDKASIKAGYFYLFFGVIGGLLIALGIVLLGAATETLPAIGASPAAMLNPKMFAWSIGLFVAGFGIKAGIAPLHLWLPRAHSAAPTPSSALLSGMLIKVGAYGLIRVGQMAGFGRALIIEVSWLGSALTIIGIGTMLVGVLAALIQSDAKRLLAYHSVSQMGYIVLGLGLGLYLGQGGGLGLSGAIYHIVNHALFKVALFLGVGIIYINTKETNLYKLGGLWRQFPITALLMLVAVLGITGAPGLNGYASKTLIHHAVSQAAQTGPSWLLWVERLFLVVGVGTAASFTKLYYLMFLGKPTKLVISQNKHTSMQLPMGLLVVAMLIIGLAPKLFLSIFAIPAVSSLGMESVAASIEHISFWNTGDIMSMVVTLILGAIICWAGLKSGAFHLQPPVWLTVEGLIKLSWSGIYALWTIAARDYHTLVKILRDEGRIWGSRMYLYNRRLNNPKGGTIGGMMVKGIGADVALLIVALAILIVWYTIINPSLPVVNMN